MERLWHKNAHTGRRQSNVNVKRRLAFMRVEEMAGQDHRRDQLDLLGQLGRLVLANDEPDIWTCEQTATTASGEAACTVALLNTNTMPSPP